MSHDPNCIFCRIAAGEIPAQKVHEGDELIAVFKTTGEDNVLLATRGGMAICFNEQDVRCMGRMSAGAFCPTPV